MRWNREAVVVTFDASAPRGPLSVLHSAPFSPLFAFDATCGRALHLFLLECSGIPNPTGIPDDI